MTKGKLAQLGKLTLDEKVKKATEEADTAEEAAHSLNFQSLPQGKAEKPGLPSPTTNGICFITLRQRKP